MITIQAKTCYTGYTHSYACFTLSILMNYLKQFHLSKLLLFLVMTVWVAVFMPVGLVSASAPQPGGDTTVVNPSGEGAVSVNEDAPQPESANIRLIVSNLSDPSGGTPSSIRILTVTGGVMQTGAGSNITLGASGTVLSLSTGRVDLRFKPDSNRDSNATFQYVVVDPHNSAVNSEASTATISITAVNDTPILQTLVGGNGTGLAATYYINQWDLTGTTYSRIDSTVNFSNNFGVPGLNDEQFSVRWTGKFRSPVTGNVTFSTQSDDGVRLWINGTQVIDNWTLHGTTTDTASPIALVEGELYDIRMEFYERGGGEVAILQWAYTGQSTQVVPQTYLYPATVRPDLSFINGSSAVVIDDALTIEDVDNTNIASASAEISTNYVSGEDELQFTNQNGITGSYSNGILNLLGSATLAQYQTALRSIKYFSNEDPPTTSTRTIRFRVYDGSGYSSYVTRNIVFSGVNNAPVITEGASTSVTMDEDATPSAFALSLNATDADEHSITWSVSSTASHGTASVGDPGNSVTVSYTPTANYYGSDSFVIQASDGQGGTDTITVNVTITDRTPPVISDISASVTASTSASFTWTSDEQASTKVSYGVTNSYGMNSAETDTSPRVTSHTKSLTGLVSCTKYHYRVTSTDATSNTANSNDGTFVTTGCTADSTPSTISNNLITATGGGSTSATASGSTIQVTAPENFTDEEDNVVIQVKALPKDAVLTSIGRPADKPREVGAVVFDVKAIINNETVLESFDAPITISYQYSAEDIAGLDISTLWLYHFTGGEWVALDDCSLNQTTRTITCTTPSFSVFALFAQPAQTSTHRSSTSTNSAGNCTDSKPTHSPNLFQITASTTQATLYFTPVTPVTGYTIQYGTNTGANQHSTSFKNSDSSGAVSHTIKDLLPDTKYYFKVLGYHGCTSGDWSQIVSSSTTDPTAGLESPHGFVSQVKQRGDIEVVETKQEYSPKTEDADQNEGNGEGYDVVIKLQDGGVPVAGATVELHSTPRKTVTDKDGIARFTGVEGGEHTVYLAYNDYTGEEKIKLEGEDKNVDISISVTLRRNQFFLSREALAIIGTLLVIITILLILLAKKKKKEKK